MRYMDIKLECNGKTLTFGTSAEKARREFAITKIEGLEASELDITTVDNALLDGTTVSGKRIGKRQIHIEAILWSLENLEEDRQRIIKFFNPKYTGTMTIDRSGNERKIEYELEDWEFSSRSDVVRRIAVSIDLLCPDPMWRDTDNFGKNMEDKTALFAFPWMVLKEKVYGVPDPYKGLALEGQVSGYRTARQDTSIDNDGDVPCGIQIKFVAARGGCTGPKITLAETGQFMHVNLAMAKGDVLLIDTDDKNQIIELNGTNAYQYIDRLSEPFKLEVGGNHLEYDADENYSNLDVVLYYTPLYLGV